MKTWKIHHIRIISSLVTYPLSPKIKPIHQVYVNVSKLPLPLTPPTSCFRFIIRIRREGGVLRYTCKRNKYDPHTQKYLDQHLWCFSTKFVYDKYF